MSAGSEFLTFDLGAESGRAVLGRVADGRIDLEEVHRFPNEPQVVLGRFHWDTLRLFAEIKRGLANCIRSGGVPAGMGVDAWGVDFALLDRDDEVLGQPYHYRDHRTDGAMERALEVLPREVIYRKTGIQFMQLNTLYQLYSMRLAGSPLLDTARTLLFTPDLLHFWLSGRKANEFTIATTSQCFDPVSGAWATEMLEQLAIPTHFLGEIVPPGTVLGELHSSLRGETGAGPIPVIAPASHDTGSAVAAVPAQGRSGWAYVSCGTWSLVGVETPSPVITDQTLAYNLTNEGGASGTFRLLRNVMGLWLLQQCRRAWERQGRSYTYDELASLAAEAQPCASLVDPDDPSFLNPPDMPSAIQEFCRATGQPIPESPAALVRCVLDSLALKYRWVVEKLEAVTGSRIEVVHVIGGGSQNRALCRAAAAAMGRTVLAGPVEATALGNIAVQAVSLGRIESLADARGMIRGSFPLQEYRPQGTGVWDDRYTGFCELLTA